MNNDTGAPRRTMLGFGAWLRIARLHFYPMTMIAYAMGALLASTAGGDFRWAAFLSGYLVLFLVEFCTILANEIFDLPSDRVNENAGMFTGGSRVLVEGALGVRSVKAGFAVALCLAVAASVLLYAVVRRPLPVTVFPLFGLLLGLGYTVPPLKLSHRGIGELDVSLTHGPFSLLFGYVLQEGTWTVPAPWLLALPFFLSVLQAILLAGLPDRKADARAGKRTIAVQLGSRATAFLSLGALLLSIPALAGLWALGILRVVPPLLLLAATLHAALLALLLARYLRDGEFDRRIDAILLVSLGYITWSGALPLIDFLLSSAPR